MRTLTFLAAVLVGFTTLSLHGAVFYFDADGSTNGNDLGSGNNLGGSGTWDSSSVLWCNDDATAMSAWSGLSTDNANFIGAGGTVAVSSNQTCGDLYVGSDPLQSGFTLTVGAGAQLDVMGGSGCYVGYSAGVGSTLEVQDGGTLSVLSALEVGTFFSDNNAVIVGGSNSVASAGSVRLGSVSSSCSLAVTNGASFYSFGDLIVGDDQFSTGASLNTTLVDNALLIVSGVLRVGASGSPDNTVTVTNNGQVQAGAVDVGGDSPGTGNRLEVSGASLTVLSGGTGYVAVTGGDVILTGGTCFTEELRLPNVGGNLTFDSGFLSQEFGTVSNGVPFVVATGGLATLQLGSLGTHYYHDGLVVAASGSLTTTGLVTSVGIGTGSNLTVAGQMSPGYGLNAGTLSVQLDGGAVAFQPTSTLLFDAGTASDLLIVSNGTVQLGGTLQITTNAGFSYASSYTLLSGLGTAPSGSFAAVTGLTTGQYAVFNYSAGDYVMSFTTNAPIFSPYDQWRQSFGLNPGDGAPLTDYDNDGIPNLLEYAFGLSPVTPSQAGLPAPQTAGTNFFFEFQRRLGTSGLEYTVQFSSNLTSWVDGCVYTDATSVTNSATMVQYGRTTNGPVETILVRSKQPLSGAASQFMRVNVLQP